MCVLNAEPSRHTIVISTLGVVVEAAALCAAVVALVVRVCAVAHLLVASVAVLRCHGVLASKVVCVVMDKYKQKRNEGGQDTNEDDLHSC